MLSALLALRRGEVKPKPLRSGRRAVQARRLQRQGTPTQKKGEDRMNALNPPGMMGNIGPFSWGMEARRPRRIVHVSGQVGADAQGVIAAGLIAQAERAFANIGTVLRAADLGPQHIVHTGIFLAGEVPFGAEERRAFNAVRVAFLGEHRPASTFITVYRLMDPSWLVEINAVAIEAEPA